MEALFEILGVALQASFVPFERLRSRQSQGMKPGLSWTTKAAAVGLLAATAPVLLFLFFLARHLLAISADDLLFVLGLILFLPLAAVAGATGIALLGAAVLGAVSLLEGHPTTRWTALAASVVGIGFGALVASLDPPTLGFLIAGACAAEALLLLLPPTASDFDRPFVL